MSRTSRSCPPPILPLLIVGACSGLIGCAAPGGQPVEASLDAGLDPSLAIAVESPGTVSSVAGHWTIEIDPIAQRGRIVDHSRQGMAIGDVYNLNVLPYGVAVDTSSLELIFDYGYLNLRYSVRHSFPAPVNPQNPASASNRADLGIAGRIVYVQQAPAGRTLTSDPASALNKDDYEFVFPVAGETAVLNPKAIPSALAMPAYEDVCFFDPADLVPGIKQNGTTAFPSTPLVSDNDPPLYERRATSSGAFIAVLGQTGNYASSDHWSSTTLVAGGLAAEIGWGGYGVLHQGQYIPKELNLNPGTEPLTLDAYVIAKYSDPRGGTTSVQKRANRLPSNDPTKFAYKMPHGAVDLAGVILAGADPLPATVGATVTRDIRLLDYDWNTAVATSGSPSESLDTIPFASGVASVEMVSEELGAQTWTPGTTNGANPSFVLYEAVPIANAVGTAGGIDAGAWVCVRFEDEEAGWVPGVGDLQSFAIGEDLAPVANPPKLVIYYPIFVPIAP